MLTIRGRVPSLYLKQLAQNLMHSIEGVREVRERMESLFVSKIGSQVVGFAQLVEDGPQAGRVAVVRLAVEWSHTSVPLRLMRSVHSYCCSRGYRTLMLDASAAPRAVLRVLSRCGFQLVPDGYEPPCVDHHVEQVGGGVPAVRTSVRILLLSHFPPHLEQVTPPLLGMRPGKAGPVELGTLCHGRRKRARSGKHHALVM